MENLRNNLQKLIDNNLMIGYHFEAIDSCIKFQKEYNLGRKSALEKTCIYGHKIRSLAEAEFYEATGDCPTCEVLLECLERDESGDALRDHEDCTDLE